MNVVFADTVGLLALWDRNDEWHVPAEAAFRRMTARGLSFMTTTFVLLECGNASARRPYRRDVAELYAEMDRDHRLIRPTESDCAAAWTAYDRGRTGDAGIVDQTSFVVMRRLGITHAFTNDRHFIAAGFEVLF